MKILNRKKEKEGKKLERTVQVTFVLAIIFAMYFVVTQVPYIPVMEDGKIIGWKNIDLSALAGQADPGVGNSGFCKVLIYAHHSNPAGYYNQANMSINASAYGNTFENNSHNMSDIPYSTAFDIIVEFRWNKTHAYSTSNNTWMLQWVNMNISCPELGIAAWETMNKYNETLAYDPDGDYYYVHFVSDNGGAGYTINKGQNVSHCFFQPSAYY